MITLFPFMTRLPGPITSKTTPFTTWDGLTYLAKLEQMHKWLEELRQNTNTGFEEIEKAVSEALTGVEDAIEASKQGVTDVVDQKVAEFTATFDELVTQIVGNSVEIQDPVFSALLTQTNTLSYTRLAEVVSGAIKEKDADPGVFVVDVTPGTAVPGEPGTPPAPSPGLAPDPKDPGFFV